MRLGLFMYVLCARARGSGHETIADIAQNLGIGRD